MKKIALVILSITQWTCAMHQEPAPNNTKVGKEGLFTDVLSMVAGPIASTAASAIEKQVTEPLKAYEQAVISQITATTLKCYQKQHAQIEALQEQVAKLQATVDKQNNRCCTIQ